MQDIIAKLKKKKEGLKYQQKKNLLMMPFINLLI